ncbi:MAG TPA: hypothetical protein ENJ18_15870 [Nannocystis exedens]|nr:hypothetical protein [Nannocystis exedens]
MDERMRGHRAADREFLAAFAACSIEPFGHRQHLRVVWLLLGELSLTAAIDRVCAGLRAFVTHLQVPERYHETITWAYVMIVHERRHQLPPDHSFEQFEQANEDLFVDGLAVIRRSYDQKTLDSEDAKTRFVWPSGCRGWDRK